jgi:hypothetical protein
VAPTPTTSPGADVRPPATTQARPPEPVPPRELRATSGAEDTASPAAIRTVLRRASLDLMRTDYNRLSGARRLQYEQSRRFSQQAQEAVRDGNFVFAATLADKAATLAAELAGG